MKGEKLQDAIGMVDDELIKDADSINVKKKAVWWKYASVAAAMLVIVATVGIVFLKESNNKDKEDKGKTDTTLLVDKETELTTNNEEETVIGYEEQPTTGVVDLPEVDANPMDLHSFAISECVYPDMAQYPQGFYLSEEYDQWRNDRNSLKEAYLNMDINQDDFFTTSIREMLSNSKGENKVYSPINVYMALGMLAEITDGNSRSQVLDLLGVESIETLREEANAILNANYSDDGRVTSILAASLWLDENINYNEDTLKVLSSTYYASAYRGRMGSDEFNSALQTWLNENTGNLLKDQIDNIEMSDETVLALATTIYYRARWSDQFGSTVKRSFYGSEGEKLCDFMIQEKLGTYYWGEKFTAVAQYLEGSGAMWFILPNEGVSVDELLEDEEAMKFIASDDKMSWNNQKNVNVNLVIPKFDVDSQIDLKEQLENLGVTDVFDPNVSDFTPMTDDVGGMFISSASHGARVSIDEEGCIATAYTIMLTESEAIPPEEKVDFIVNRPFIFAITSEVKMPLFVGVVNNVN